MLGALPSFQASPSFQALPVGRPYVDCEEPGVHLENLVDIASFPPLPIPDRQLQRTEERRGILVVLVVCLVYILAVHSIMGTATNKNVPDEVYWIAFGAIYTEALIAVTCLVGLMVKEPGVIHRSPETCFPLPDAVVGALRCGDSFENWSNIQHEDGCQSFCIRCFVWRRNAEPLPAVSLTAPSLLKVPGCRTMPHHCSTCQRCVSHFDHHCGVFGRCIAGRLWQGNVPYFLGIILMGQLGTATCFTSVMVVSGYGKYA